VKPKILIYDLEVTPILGYTYGLYDTNVIEIVRESYIMCFSYRWLGENKTYNIALTDFPARYKLNPHDDIDVVKALHKLLDEADIVVAHNANRFDNKVSTGRFLTHNLLPPSPYFTVDTLTVARGKAKFSSNALDKLGQHLEIGRKTKVKHSDLWKACVDGDRKAWAKMVKYCNQDVDLLHKLYLRLRPYINNHPNLANISQRPDSCPRCGGTHLQSKGVRHTAVGSYRRFICKNCGAYVRERTQEKGEYVKPTYVNA